MEKDNDKQLVYTLIVHEYRIRINLKLLEYCVADSIYHLSNNPKSQVKGWCYASKDTIAKILGVSRQAVFDSITRLINKGIIERDNETKYLRTTSVWYDNVILPRAKTEYSKETLLVVNNLDSNSKETLLPVVKKLDTHSKETLPYNNTITINNKNTNNTCNSEELRELNKSIPTYFSYWSDVNHKYKDWYNNKTERAAILKLLTDKDINQDALKWILKHLKEVSEIECISKVSTPYFLEKNFSDVVRKIKQEYNSKRKRGVSIAF